MAGTRSSQRSNASSPPSSAKATNGTKRKADEASSPPANTKAKRGRPSKAAKEQKTLEETMPSADDDAEMNDAPAGSNGNGEQKNGDSEFKRPDGCWGWIDTADYGSAAKPVHGTEAEGESKTGATETTDCQDGEAGKESVFQGKTKEGEDGTDPEKKLKDSRGGAGLNALDQVKADDKDDGTTSKKTEKQAHANGGGTTDVSHDAIEDDKSREKAQPSNITEKGIIYFFTRGRVGTDNPDSVQDLQRSFFVLRPLPAGGKLTDGAVEVKNARVFALPKKVWPKSSADKFMSFVEKAGASISELKSELFEGSTYSTKTTGTNHTPNIAPIGEGVYAFTHTGGGRGSTHLVYHLTIPSKLGEVQQDVGIRQKGSFAISLKNPEVKGPANAALPQGPDWPKEFIEEFGGRGWMPPHPKHLDYANAQILLIGEDYESSSNLDAAPKDAKGDKETPEEELEKLEHEDEVRVEHLNGDDTIFADLELSTKEYGLMTTW
nr:hypothetical protein B0A51_00948 [Rachicladosporium sp. CCFEE 5018]